MVQLGVQIAHRARAPVKRHREAVRFVADPLHEQQRRVIRSQRDRLLAIARVEQLLLLGNPDADEVCETELLERRVGRRELAFAAVDQDQVRKRSAFLQQLAVAAEDDFVHGGEVVRGLKIGV